jgi:SAM-dependent methyltransferase
LANNHSAAPSSSRKLNLGCGNRFHPDWTNIDIATSSPLVIRHNLRKGIPFAGDTFEVCYHSHILEHFDREQAPAFLAECHRVLKPGGVIRVAVPDLEQIARLYLTALENAMAGATGWEGRRDWMLLELIDQAARHRPGGYMGACLRDDEPAIRGFISERIGLEAMGYGQPKARSQAVSLATLRRICGVAVRNPGRIVREAQHIVARVLLGRQYFAAARLGMFRLGGEVHLWMYDRFSLRRALENTGFRCVQQCTAHESRIDGFAAYHLDTLADGTVCKPDSLYMEAEK